MINIYGSKANALEILTGLMRNFFKKSDAVDSDGFLASDKFIVDSSVYAGMANLYQAMSEPKLAEMFRKKADKQKWACWGASESENSGEPIDYQAL